MATEPGQPSLVNGKGEGGSSLDLRVNAPHSTHFKDQLGSQNSCYDFFQITQGPTSVKVGDEVKVS